MMLHSHHFHPPNPSKSIGNKDIASTTNNVFIFCCDITSTSAISGIFILHQSVNVENIGIHIQDDVNVHVRYNHDIFSAVYIRNNIVSVVYIGDNINIAIDCTTVDITK